MVQATLGKGRKNTIEKSSAWQNAAIPLTGGQFAYYLGLVSLSVDFQESKSLCRIQLLEEPQILPRPCLFGVGALTD
jgi:hypothetical protein